jgi:hypothetical protein
MALVLSLKEGQDFYVGPERFVVDSVIDETNFTLTRASDARVFKITDARAAEIADEVFVSAGDKPMAVLARVSIEAPPEKLILRGDKYRQQKQQAPRYRGGRR